MNHSYKNLEETKKLAQHAFTEEFRAVLADAVLQKINTGSRLVPYPLKNADNCRCPFGCLPKMSAYPSKWDVTYAYGLSPEKIALFMNGFDNFFNGAIRYNLPEEALGILYRNKFFKKDENF